MLKMLHRDFSFYVRNILRRHHHVHLALANQMRYPRVQEMLDHHQQLRCVFDIVVEAELNWQIRLTSFQPLVSCLGYLFLLVPCKLFIDGFSRAFHNNFLTLHLNLAGLYHNHVVTAHVKDSFCFCCC